MCFIKAIRIKEKYYLAKKYLKNMGSAPEHILQCLEVKTTSDAANFYCKSVPCYRICFRKRVSSKLLQCSTVLHFDCHIMLFLGIYSGCYPIGGCRTRGHNIDGGVVSSAAAASRMRLILYAGLLDAFWVYAKMS
jgi:hypothetical protein